MNSEQRPHLLRTLFRRGSMLLFCLLVAAVTGLSATGWADSLYLTAGSKTGEAAILLGQAREAPRDLSSQMLYLSNGGRGYDLILREGAAVTIRHGDTDLTVRSRKESISSLLSRLHIDPGPGRRSAWSSRTPARSWTSPPSSPITNM